MNALLIGGLGPMELVLILIIVLVVFGAGKLPQIGDALGKGIRNFKKASNGNEDVDVTPARKADALPPNASTGERIADAEEIAKKH